MHLSDNVNFEHLSQEDFTTPSCEQLGMFESLGMTAYADEIFAWEADFLSGDIIFTDLKSGEEQSKTLEEFLFKVNSEDVLMLRSNMSFISSYERRQINFKIRLLRNGHYKTYQVKGIAFNHDDRVFAVGFAYENNLTESSYKRLEYLEKHDALTGLANANALDMYVNDVFKYGMYPQTLIVAKIDKFNEINDSFGYGAGNTLIKNVAEVIKDCFFDAEMIARIGGGEYCAVYAGKGPLEIDNKIKEARMMLHGMYMNLVKTEVSFGYAAVDTAVSFCDLYRQALQRMRKNRDLRTVLKEETVIDSLNSIIEQKMCWGKRQIRLQSLATQVATVLGCGEECINEIKVLAKIADIGLIGISEELLKNRYSLNEKDMEDYMRHIDYGHEIISRLSELSCLQDLYLDIFKRYDEWQDALTLSSCIVAGVRGFDDIVSAGHCVRFLDIKDRFIKKRGAEYCPRVVNAIIKIAGRHYVDGY